MNSSDTPIKVLHIITGLYTGGAERFLSRLVEGIGPEFETVVVSLGDRGTLGEKIESTGARLYTLGMNRLWPGPLGLLRIVPILLKEKPRIIQSWLYHADLIAYLCGRFIARRARVVWNIRNSNIDLSKRSFLHGLLFRWLARVSGRLNDVITNTKAGQAFHEQHGYAPRRWHYIPNGFDPAVWRPEKGAPKTLRKEWDLPANAFVFGLVARFDPQKGHFYLIEAAAELFKDTSLPPTYFVLAGRGVADDNAALLDALGKHGIADRFRLLGERSDIVALNSAFDVALSTSGFGEGFPNSLGEAMACGTPCLATDSGDTAYLVGDTGTLVPTAAPEKLAEALAFWAHMPASQRASFGKRARARVIAEFSLEKVVESYSALYRFILT